jgi:uncharacterized protein (TIGR04255 family)
MGGRCTSLARAPRYHSLRQSPARDARKHADGAGRTQPALSLAVSCPGSRPRALTRAVSAAVDGRFTVRSPGDSRGSPACLPPTAPGTLWPIVRSLWLTAPEMFSAVFTTSFEVCQGRLVSHLRTTCAHLRYLATLMTWPPPDTTTLPNAPLELVVFQVRFDQQAALSPNAALRAKKLLGGQYDHLEPAVSTDFMIQMTPDGPQASEAKTSGWRYLSADRRWTVSLFRDQATIECTGYIDWDGFEERSANLITTVASIFAPQIVQRVGLRYVDRILRAKSKTPADWVGLLDPAVLGFAAGNKIASSVEIIRTEHSLNLDDCKAIVRTSCAPDDKGPSWHSMLVDTDCYEDRAFAFAEQDLKEKVKTLHGVALQLFQYVTTPKLRAEWA